MFCCCQCLSNANHDPDEGSQLLPSSYRRQRSDHPADRHGPSGRQDSSIEASLVSSMNKSSPYPQSAAIEYVDGRVESLPLLVMKPVEIRSVSKRLQDHASLYNAHLDQWNRLNEQINELTDMFPEQNPMHSLDGAFRHLKQICGNCSSITLKRVSEFCLEVNYEGSEVPYSAIPAFIAFNGANRRVKEILEKGPPLIKFLQLVVDNAKDLRREILVAGLGPQEPKSLENCYDNLELLKGAIDNVAYIAGNVKIASKQLQKFDIR